MLSVLFACTVLAVFAMTASAKDETPEEFTPDQEYLAETEEDPVIALWDELEGLPVEEAEERYRQCLLDAGYMEVYEETNVTKPMDMDDETYDLAYSDLESADPETQEKILAARRVIIFQYSWQADDGLGFMYDPTTKEFSFTPRFSDLFPGWDLPVEPGYPKKAPVEPETVEPESVTEEEAETGHEPEEPERPDDAGIQPLYDTITSDHSTYVRKFASGTGLTDPFYSFTIVAIPAYCPVSITAKTLPTGTSKYNFGITDEYTGSSIYWRKDCTLNQKIPYTINQTSDEHRKIGFRVSTYQNPGNGVFRITRRYWGA